MNLNSLQFLRIYYIIYLKYFTISSRDARYLTGYQHEYTNGPGGIVNGITSGLENEDDIDFNLSYASTGKDYDWRWAEQWLPHAAWYLLAVAEAE